MTENSAVAEAPPLHFTDAAAHKVGQLIEQEGNASLKLRVYVQGGGCSGFQYGFTFDEEVQEGDAEIENGGVTLLVDPMSVQYLMGAEIDYREDLSGAQFIIRNPNAATTCGRLTALAAAACSLSWISLPLTSAPIDISMSLYCTLPITRAFGPSSTRSVARTSPLTVPLSITWGTTTEPSIQPRSLMLSTERSSFVARTLPLT